MLEPNGDLQKGEIRETVRYKEEFMLDRDSLCYVLGTVTGMI